MKVTMLYLRIMKLIFSKIIDLRYFVKYKILSTCFIK